MPRKLIQGFGAIAIIDSIMKIMVILLRKEYLLTAQSPILIER